MLWAWLSTALPPLILLAVMSLSSWLLPRREASPAGAPVGSPVADVQKNVQKLRGFHSLAKVIGTCRLLLVFPRCPDGKLCDVGYFHDRKRWNVRTACMPLGRPETGPQKHTA